MLSAALAAPIGSPEGSHPYRPPDRDPWRDRDLRSPAMSIIDAFRRAYSLPRRVSRNCELRRRQGICEKPVLVIATPTVTEVGAVVERR